jgi:hypothetical protein
MRVHQTRTAQRSSAATTSPRHRRSLMVPPLSTQYTAKHLIPPSCLKSNCNKRYEAADSTGDSRAGGHTTALTVTTTEVRDTRQLRARKCRHDDCKHAYALVTCMAGLHTSQNCSHTMGSAATCGRCICHQLVLLNSPAAICRPRDAIAHAECRHPIHMKTTA